MTLTDRDIKSVISRMGGDIELLTHLLSLLAVQAQVWIDEGDVLIHRQDVAGVCRWLHTLRGTLGSLGFEEFCGRLEWIERDGRNHAGLLHDVWWESIGQIQHSLGQLPDTVPLLIAKLHDAPFLESRS